MGNSTCRNQRTVWIDNLKGVLLILIVSVHLGEIPGGVRWLFRSTDLIYVPAFFFLSGLLFRDAKYSFSGFFHRKVKTLLVPYLAISVVVTLLDWNLYRNPVQTLSDSASSIFWGNGALKASPLWFVATLFCANILLKAGYAIKNGALHHAFFIAMPFACYALYWYGIRLPFRLDSALGACFVMYTARYFKPIDSLNRGVRLGVSLVCLAVVSLGIVKGVGLLNYNMPHALISFPAAVAGCYLLCVAFRRLAMAKFTPPYGLRRMDCQYSGSIA